MKTLLFIVLFLSVTSINFRIFKTYFVKLFTSNKFFFWSTAILMNLLAPYVLLLLISITIHPYFYAMLHTGSVIVMVSLLCNVVLLHQIKSQVSQL